MIDYYQLVSDLVMAVGAALMSRWMDLPWRGLMRLVSGCALASMMLPMFRADDWALAFQVLAVILARVVIIGAGTSRKGA